jgi:hypothetical protein
MSPSSKVNRLGRELGIGTIFLISGLQKAGEHILRNACYTFAFNLSDSASVYAACLHLQLDQRCQRMLGSLLPGQCIFRQTQATWNTAMWCHMDYAPPARNIGRIEYAPHPYTPAMSLSEAPHVLADLDAAVEEHTKAGKRQKDDTPAERTQYTLKLLRLRVENPYAPVARLFDAMGDLRFEAQVAIRETLENERLAAFEEVRIGRSNRLLMDVTDKGYGTLGLPVPEENKGRGTITHRHFAHWIKQHFEKQGHKAHIEWLVPGTNHPADVAVQLENGWEVFEVCVTCFDNLVSHMKACFEGSNAVAHLTIVVATRAQMNELKKSLRSDFVFTMYADRISFDVIQSYMMKELDNERD